MGRLERPILGLPPLGRVELALSPDLLDRRSLLVAAVVVEAVVSWQENFVKNFVKKNICANDICVKNCLS
jgi:hypothetical protein